MKTFELDFSSPNIEGELSDYLLQQTENNITHFSYKDEKTVAKAITEGRFEELDEIFKQIKDFSCYKGIMSYSKIKQVEYTCITGITLLTRYAMDAGVDETISYALSDIALQNISCAKTAEEINQIFSVIYAKYEELIKKAVATKKSNCCYIKECKSYISKNIQNKMTLNEIAEHVGLHPVYLSRLFSTETGLSISNYITQSKIEFSCKLLEYSDKSISMIAEYLNMAPQSNYTRVFKKVMDISPAQYRKEHQTVQSVLV